MAASERKVEKETVTVVLENKEFYCAFTNKLLSDPVSLSCGHYAEKKAAASDCGICKKPVEIQAKPTHFFKKVLDVAIKSNPHLKDEKTEKNTCTIELDEKEFFCPVELNVLFEPCELGCGHICDFINGVGCFAVQGNCPVCKTEITSFNKPNPFFQKIFDIALKINPWFADKLYFPIKALSLIQSKESVDRVIPLIKKHPHIINQIYTEPEHEGKTVLLHLLGLTLCALLKEHPELIDAINSDTLNSRYEGISSVTLLAQAPIGREILRDHPALRAKITSEAFNWVVPEKNNNISALQAFAASPMGGKMLLQDHELRAKVSSAGLNSISEIPSVKGASAIFILLDNESGFNILQEDKAFREKVTDVGLNAICEADKYKNMSTVFLMTNSEKGIDIFREDKELRSKIRPKGLNALCQLDKYKNESAVFHLIGTQKGLEMLLEDKPLRDSIMPDALNAISQSPRYKGQSSLWPLFSQDKGLELVRKDTELRDKILPSGLNAVSETGAKGLAPIFCLLQSDEGRQLLEDPTLRAKITAEGLNSIATEGEHKGMSVIGMMIFHCSHILLKDERLVSLISPTVLHTPMGPGFTVAQMLQETAQGKSLLSKYPSLREKVMLSSVSSTSSTMYYHRDKETKIDPTPSEKRECHKTCVIL